MITMLAALLGITLIGQRPISDAVCVDLKGQQVVPMNSRARSSNRATVLIFYLAHCPISQKLTPEINRVFQEFSPKGVQFYMIHEDLTLSSSEIAQEAKNFGLLPPILIDKWRTQMKRSGASISPEAVVYDGGFRMTYRGRINDQFFDLGKMRPKVTKRDLREAIIEAMAGTSTGVKLTAAVGCVLPKS